MSKAALRTIGLLVFTVAFTSGPAALSQGVDVQPGQPGLTPPNSGRTQPGTPLPGARSVEKPANPDAVRGTYELNGQKVTVTEGEFYASYLLLKPHLERPERPLREDQVLEHLLLFAEADAMGLTPTAAEVAKLNPAKTNAAFADQVRARWAQMGISEEQFEEYTKQTRAILRMKDWFSNTVRVTSQEVFDLWKRDHFLYRVAYLAFPASQYLEELKATPPTDQELEEFWRSNPTSQSRHRRPTTIDAMILVYDPAKVSEEELARRRAENAVSRSDALAYYRKNRERLDAQIPSDQRPQLYPPPGSKVPVAELVTPFQLLKDQIEREILLGNGIAQAFQEIEGLNDKAGWEAIAKKHGLELRTLDDATMEAVARGHSDLGPSLANGLFSASPGTASPSVQFFGSRQFCWLLSGKTEASLPDLAEVRTEVLEDWFTNKSRKKALDAANALMASINEQVDAELASEMKAIDDTAAKNAESDISGRGLTDERAKQSVRQRFANLAENQKRTLRAERAPKYFDSAVEKAGLTFEEAGPFAFEPLQVDRTSIESRAEQILAYFSSSYPLRSLQEGQMSQVMTDAVTDTHFIVKVLSRAEPEFQDMPDVDFFQKRMALERQNTFTTNYQWTGFQARKRLNWNDAQ